MLLRRKLILIVKNNKYSTLVLLHISSFIFSFAGVITKYMGIQIKEKALFSLEMFLLFVGLGSIYIAYAYIWQYVLKKMTLSVAYLIKSTVIIWSMIWSILIFHERLTLMNIVGIVCIMIGIVILQKE